MPRRTKKLLIYLDQNFISEMAKAGLNERVKPEFTRLADLLQQGFTDEKLVVPQSFFHDIETSLIPELRERIQQRQDWLGQVSLHNADHVRNFQIGTYLKAFLGKTADPLAPGIVFRENPDRRVQPFMLRVNTRWELWDFRSERQQTAEKMEAIRLTCLRDKTTFEEHLAAEFDDQRRLFFKHALAYHGHLCNDPQQDLVAFGNHPTFLTIPIVSIYSRMWASLFTRCPTRVVSKSDAIDIDVLSTYLPYMDVVATDAFMAEQLRSLGIDKEHDVHVFHAKTKRLQGFVAFLEEYLSTHERVNRPRFSLFVLPAPQIKEDSLEFYRHLCNSARAIREPEWVDVYGFDDGNMPKYQFRHQVGKDGPTAPFFGLQDVTPLRLPQGATRDEILQLCRQHCLSEAFLVIHEHFRASRDFVTQAVHAAQAGQKAFNGYQLFRTQRHMNSEGPKPS